ncbi:hypothetical protein SAMN05444166_7216 [Singulisphaera sp. GP187]|uniref:hypothetical protein n=1 Tax=Singulisphaera sp. GP187 TaxID=1882752 RepID=UPI000928B582|nr:hypothetical protein [Singulisphaera sp. GP187]SIO63014.1 hypothetical protein SAMN05444166_7216 [Singulisphaera sp. GP187]
MVDDETSDSRFDDVVGDWNKLEEQAREFAERANDAAQTAARERREAAKWPASSELRERHEKEVQRWDKIAEWNLIQSEYLSKRSDSIRSFKIRFRTGVLTLLPENRREEGAWISMLSRQVRIDRGGAEIFCQRCRRGDRFDVWLGPPLPDVALQEKAAAHFFKAGWRLECKLECKALCPDCLTESSREK